MNTDKLQEYIKIAKEAVKNEEEPFKSEGFKIILNKLLNSSVDEKNVNAETTKQEHIEIQSPSDIESKKRTLAEKCKITVEELNDIISIKDDKETIEIIAPIEGSDAKKHIIVSLCLLAVNEFILEKEWVESTKIAECLRSVGVKDLGNLSFTLRRNSLLIRAQGSKFGRKYKLTSNEGRTKAFEIMNKLANHEEISI